MSIEKIFEQEIKEMFEQGKKRDLALKLVKVGDKLEIKNIVDNFIDER